jgi:hypothetical protein
MGYYQGDYYRGTAGDPFLGGLFSKVFTVGKALLGFPGGGKVLPGVAGPVTLSGAGGALKRVGGKIVAIAKQHPVLTGAGAAGIIGLGGAGAERELFGGGGGRMRGFHPCKSKHGCKSGAMVRNRHMNPCNPRALRRAIRRAHSFERLAKHVIGFSSPRKPKGHMYFKKRRRK